MLACPTQSFGRPKHLTFTNSSPRSAAAARWWTSYETPFGIRTIRFDANEGFFLNGKRVELKGTVQPSGPRRRGRGGAG